MLRKNQIYIEGII